MNIKLYNRDVYMNNAYTRATGFKRERERVGVKESGKTIVCLLCEIKVSGYSICGSTRHYKVSLISHEAFKHQSFIVQHVRLYNRVASTLSPLHTVTMMLKASHINTQVDTDDDINTSLPVFSDSPRIIIL